MHVPASLDFFLSLAIHSLAIHPTREHPNTMKFSFRHLPWR